MALSKWRIYILLNKMRRKYIIYNMVMALLSLVIAIILILQLTINLSYEVEILLTFIDFIIWVIFVIDYILRLYRSVNKKKFIKKNLIDLISIIPIYSIFRVFKVLNLLKIGRLTRLSEISKIIRILAIIRRSNKNISEFMRTNNFNYTVGIAMIIILVGSVMMSYVENISIGDALWWSIVTVTTVGYGDVYPVKPLGKIIASILMIMGIGLIGSLTSTLSSYFIKKEEKRYKNIKEKDIDVEKEKYKLNDLKEYVNIKEEIKYSKDNYKNKLIIDIINKIEKFDELSKEDLNTMCNVLKSLKEK